MHVKCCRLEAEDVHAGVLHVLVTRHVENGVHEKLRPVPVQGASLNVAVLKHADISHVTWCGTDDVSNHGTCMYTHTRAQGDSDVHVTLSPTVGTSYNEKFYEVVVGGWDDARSVIRQCLSDGKCECTMRSLGVKYYM